MPRSGLVVSALRANAARRGRLSGVLDIGPRTTLALIILVACRIGAAAEEQSRQCTDSGPDALVSAPTVTVSTLNVSHGRRTALNQLFVSKKRTYRNLDGIASLLDEIDADFIALQEADAASKWSGTFDHVQYLVDNTGYNCFIHGRHARSWLYSYGTALLSKSGLVDSRAVDFEPSFPTTTKGYVQAKFDWHVDGNIVPVTLVSVHLDYSRKKVRDSQIEEMIAALSDLNSELIIMGDLNSRWSDKRSHVRDLANRLGLDAYDSDAADLGTYKSTTGKRLDWILVSPRLEFIEYKVLPDIVADHLAVYAEIRYRGE